MLSSPPLFCAAGSGASEQGSAGAGSEAARMDVDSSVEQHSSGDSVCDPNATVGSSETDGVAAWQGGSGARSSSGPQSLSTPSVPTSRNAAGQSVSFLAGMKRQ